MDKRASNGADRRRAVAVIVVAVLSMVAVLVGSGGGSAGATEGRRFIIGTEAEIRSLPTSGAAWQALRAAADAPLTTNLANQDDLSPASAVAAALVHVRTGETSYRDRVVAALRAIPGTEVGGRTLSLGRQLAGWIVAADLVGYRDPAFVEWVQGVRTKWIGGHGRWVDLTQTHEATSSNWGAFAGASRIAASLYLGDAADVARAAQVFRGWLGDRAAWPTLAVGQSGPGFTPTADFDPSWACAYPTWQPVNGACGDRAGALVEDISRGEAYPDATSIGLSYSWEALQGATMQAILLGRNGYPDVWTWQGSALRGTVAFLAGHAGFEDANFNRVNHWVPAAIDQVYGTTFADRAAGHGRNFGFTDWLPITPVGVATATTTPTTSATTSSTSTPTTSSTTSTPTTTSTTTTTAPKTTSTTTTPTTAAAPTTTTTTAPVMTTTTAPAKQRTRIAHQECVPGPPRCRQSEVTEV